MCACYDERVPDGSSQIGRYQILGELGTGGMGSVHLARVAGPGRFERLIALKTIHPHLARKPSFVGMFLDEARLAAKIRHPHVVPVFDVGESEGTYFIAMDYVSGEPLSRVLRRLHRARRRMPLPIALYIMAAALEGLHAAHEVRDATGRLLGVVHRDISPKNILIGYDGLARLLDFGVAKARDRITDTGTGPRKGTISYMAPEQLVDGPCDRRVDVFAAGVVLWEMTVGMRLFKGANDTITADNILRARVPLPSAIHSDYPKDLELLVIKALSSNREHRFGTAREMATALRRCSARLGTIVSSADTEHFMSELFADRHSRRIEMETAASLPERSQLALLESSEDDDYADSEPSAAELVAKGALTKAGHRAMLRPIAIVAVVALIVAGLGVGARALERPKPETKAAPSSPMKVDAVVVERPPEPETVTLTFDVDPPNAVLEVDGTTLDGGFVILPRSNETHALRATAPQRAPMNMRIAAIESRTIQIHLEAAAPAHAKKTKSKRSTSSAPRTPEAVEEKPVPQKSPAWDLDSPLPPRE